MMIVRRAAVCATAWLAAGCGAGAAPPALVERTDSAGVEIVLSRGADVALDWTFTPVLTLGGADEGPEAFFGISSHSIAVGHEGALYILDNGNHQVHVFDADGRHLRTMGRKGGGPGELQLWPNMIRLAADGTVYVYDIGKNGLVRFAADGSPLPEIRLDIFGRMIEGYALMDEDVVVKTTVRASAEDDPLNALVAVSTAGDTTHVLHTPSPPLKPAQFNCVAISGMTEIFAPELRWSASGSRIYAATSAEYVIDVYEAGRRVASIRRDLAPRPASRDLAIRAVGDKMEVRFGGGGSCVVQPDEVVDVRGFANVVPAIGETAVAPDGTIWVQRYAIRDEAAPIDILGPDGAYLGTLPAGTPFPAAFYPDGRIVVVEKDEFDVPRVVVYRVEGWSPASGLARERGA